MAPDRLQFPHGAAFPGRNSQADNGEAGGVQGGVRLHTFSAFTQKRAGPKGSTANNYGII